MSAYIKYFKGDGKNMSLMAKDDDMLDKYNKIWDKIKAKLSIKLHSASVYDEKYIKTKVNEFDGVIKTNFLGCVTIDSVMIIEKKNYPQVFLEECKFKTKKIKINKLINTELESESESESESKSDGELMARIESASDSDFE